ncbi:MAG: InlB B-repeat-containing protein, partial [Firmicutes bacterium]|nr:InlB B-repeat-containing protein [Bacillota bacterium]
MKKGLLLFVVTIMAVLTAAMVFTGCKQKRYSVIFDCDGGSFANGAESVKIVTTDGVITTPAESPVKRDLSGSKDLYFDGWYLDKGTYEMRLDDGYRVIKDLVVYPLWRNRYELRLYQSEGGSYETRELIESYPILKPVNPVRAGYVFDDPAVFEHANGKDIYGYNVLGWYQLNPIPSTYPTQYNRVPYDFGSAATGNVTVYAGWRQLITVTFDTVDGDAFPSVTAPERTGISNPGGPTNTARPRLKFAGWHINKNFNSNSEWRFSDDEDIAAEIALSKSENRLPNSLPTRADTNLTAYAEWRELIVSFETLGGTAVPNQYLPYGVTAQTPAKPTRTNYYFDGWYTDRNYHADTEWNFNTTVTDDVTLYAYWATEGYTNGLKFTAFFVNGEQQYEVSKGSMRDDVDIVVIPRVYHNCLVTRIGDFSDTNIKNIRTFEGTDLSTSRIEYIADRAFENTPLTSITLNTNGLNGKLKTIGARAFANSGLTNVVVPATVQTIGKEAFAGCDLAQITLPFVGASRVATGVEAVLGYIFSSSSLAGTYAAAQAAGSATAAYYLPDSLTAVTL